MHADVEGAHEAAGDPYRLLREHTPDGAPSDPAAWFAEHHRNAPDRVLELLERAGVKLVGQDVVDVGCGDGIIDLGLFQRGGMRRLVGYDLMPVDAARLTSEAHRYGALEGPLPSGLTFEVCEDVRIPAESASFDVAVSWSTFEHVRRPVEVLTEIRRILRPGGALFLQIWPMYHSEHGSHLWPWYPSGFANLTRRRDQLEATLAENPIGPAAHAQFLLEESTELNRLTVDELQRALLASGFLTTHLQLRSDDVHLPVELGTYSVLDLAISGIELIAVTPDD